MARRKVRRFRAIASIVFTSLLCPLLVHVVITTAEKDGASWFKTPKALSSSYATPLAQEQLSSQSWTQPATSYGTMPFAGRERQSPGYVVLWPILGATGATAQPVAIADRQTDRTVSSPFYRAGLFTGMRQSR